MSITQRPHGILTFKSYGGHVFSIYQILSPTGIKETSEHIFWQEEQVTIAFINVHVHIRTSLLIGPEHNFAHRLWQSAVNKPQCPSRPVSQQRTQSYASHNHVITRLGLTGLVSVDRKCSSPCQALCVSTFKKLRHFKKVTNFFPHSQ